MHLLQALFSQGFGSRKSCEALIKSGLVKIGNQVSFNPYLEVSPSNLVLTVDGQEWLYRPRAYVALHKPPGYECSRQPQRYPSVLSLLPQPLQRRNIQPVGRLDADTTGLLFLTDDGALLHKLTSPKHQTPKIYEVVCKHLLSDEQIAQLLKGVTLRDDPEPICAQSISRVSEQKIHLTITQGKYHQVKRMVAAAGNRVDKLHRIQIGQFRLPPNLEPGQWIWIDNPSIILAR